MSSRRCSHLLSQTLVPYGQPMLTRIMLGLVLLLLLLVLLMLLLMLLLLLLATVFADKIHAGASLVVVAVAVDAAAVVATVVAAGWEVFGLRCTLSVFSCPNHSCDHSPN